MIANRQAYGEALVELFQTNKDLVVLDADLAKATYTEIFRRAHPDRFFDCGIAEQNMMSVAAGMSTCGLIPFVSTFAVFASLRASEQFRNSICYPHLNVKIGATHAGVECGADGATHEAIEDLAVMRAMAGNTVLVPADPTSTKKLVFLAASFNGPCYLRMGRDKVPDIYDSSATFKVGGSHCLKRGSQAAILAIGSRVQAALEAAELLLEKGIDVSVYDMYSIKPIDEDAIKEAAETGTIVTVEDHSITGGLGSAVCEAVCTNALGIPVRMLGIQNTFGRSGSSDELFKFYHIDVTDIVDAVTTSISNKRK